MSVPRKFDGGNLMIATMLGTPIPEGFTAITDEKVRGSLTQLFLKARMGWQET
jgi:hypothetical protein